MDTVADRLTKALNQFAPLNVRGDKKALAGVLSARMESADKRPGTSYPSVLGYFAGRTQPSLDWITEAALVMGVRREWLAFWGLTPVVEVESPEGLAAALRAEAGFDLDNMHYANRQLFTHTYMTRASQRSGEQGGGVVGGENMVAAWREVLDLLRFPYRRMGRSGASQDAVSRWQTAAMHAFDLAMQMEPALNDRDDDSDVHLDAERMPKER